MKQHPHSVMHSGGSVGGESMLILCLEHQHAVAVVKNVDPSPEADTFSLALRSLDIFYRHYNFLLFVRFSFKSI